MSATMHLWKPMDIEVIPPKYYFLPEMEREHLDDQYKNSTEEQTQQMYKEYYDVSFADGKEHDTLNVDFLHTKYKGYKHIRNKRIQKYRFVLRKKFEKFVRRYSWAPGHTCNEIPIDEVCYAQGWMFNRKFFKYSNTEFMCFTKDDMIATMDRYMKAYHKVATQSLEENGWVEFDRYNPGELCYYVNRPYDLQKIKDKFIKAWNDNYEEGTGLIFYMAF